MPDEQQTEKAIVEKLSLNEETVSHLTESEGKWAPGRLRPSDTCTSFATGTEPVTCYCP